MIKDIKIKTKLILGFLIVILISSLINLYSIHSMGKIKDFTIKMYNHPFTVNNSVSDVQNNILKIHREMKDISTADNNHKIQQSIKYVDEYEEDVYEDFKIIDKQFLGDKTMVNDAEQAFKNWKPIRDEVIQLTLDDKKDAAIAITKGKGAEQVKLLNNKMKVLEDFAQNKAKGFFNDVNDESSLIIIISTIVLIITFLAASILAFIIIKDITSGLSKLTLMIKDLSEGEGDLTQRIDIKSKNELGEVSKWFNLFISKIQSLASSIKNNTNSLTDSSNNLASISQQIAAVSQNVSIAIQDVAKGTGSQAEDLVNITSILDEFSEELGSMVEAIKEIDLKARETQSMADKGSNDMHILVQSISKTTHSFNDFIDKISSLSGNISQINEITDVINSIADQTNLLALNASIEAARAGEAGKGFSIVADEIRKLAEQSKTSAQSINLLISNISNDTNIMLKTTDEMDSELNNQDTVINTTIDSFKQIIKRISEIVPKIEMVNDSAKSVENEKDSILEKIEGVSSIAEEISASCQEISASSEEMNASTEEVASTAQMLDNMTKEVGEQVNIFKV